MGESLESAFWTLALAGTLVFAVKLALMFMGMNDDGGDLDLDMDADLDGGIDFGHDHDVGHDHAHDDSTRAFNLLSVQSLACLAMGAGWMGLAAQKSLRMAPLEAITIALGFGLALVYLMGLLLRKARNLESSGTLDLRNAVGRSGTVYMRITAGGVGQVQIVIQGRLATVEARSVATEIVTGTRVQVDSVDANGTLVVSPV